MPGRLRPLSDVSPAGDQFAEPGVVAKHGHDRSPADHDRCVNCHSASRSGMASGSAAPLLLFNDRIGANCVVGTAVP